VPDAVVFDLDGTPRHERHLRGRLNRVLAGWDRPRAGHRADVRQVSGMPHFDARSSVPRPQRRRLARVAELTAEADNAAVAAHGGPLYPGVREHVPRLAARVPLMIVSNCQRGYIETFLDWSGLAPHFVDHECWGNTGATKADNLATIVHRNILARPLFVGDTEGDRTAAEANGIPFVHVTYGFGAVARCDHRVDRFEELVALLA
jgi:phosphoglycolate phosphatase